VEIGWSCRRGNGSGGPIPALFVALPGGTEIRWPIAQDEGLVSARVLGCPADVLGDFAEARLDAAEDLREANRRVGAFWSEVL